MQRGNVLFDYLATFAALCGVGGLLIIHGARHPSDDLEIEIVNPPTAMEIAERTGYAESLGPVFAANALEAAVFEQRILIGDCRTSVTKEVARYE